MSTNKAKGTAFETAVCDVFREGGFPYVERRALTGAFDKGDISGIPWLVVECKVAKRLELGEWMKETEREAHNANVETGLLVVKRRMHHARRAFAIQPLEDWVGLAYEADYAHR